MGENVFNGANFLDWDMNLRIILGAEKLLYNIDRSHGPEPGPERPVDRELWKTHRDDSFTAQPVILATMTPQLCRQNNGLDPHEMMMKFMDLYRYNLRSQKYELQKKLFLARISDGTSIEHYVSQMISNIEQLGHLGIVFEAETSIDLILQSLPDYWGGFIMNYNMMN